MADETKKRVTLDELSQEIGSAVIGVLKEAEDFSGPQRSQMVLDAAWAYRALRGGAQPGGSAPAK